jgi:hypothetical protein
VTRFVVEFFVGADGVMREPAEAPPDAAVVDLAVTLDAFDPATVRALTERIAANLASTHGQPAAVRDAVHAAVRGGMN